MENKVLIKNLDRIAQYNKILANKILMTDIEKTNLELSQTTSNEYNLLLNGYEIHNSNNPIIEAKSIAKNNSNDINSLIIVYGLGLGYLVDAINQECEKSKILVYEPNMELLKFVLSIAQIDALFNNNVFLCADLNHFHVYLKQLITPETNLSITFLDSYNRLFRDDIDQIFKQAKDILAEKVGNNNTFIQYMPLASKSTMFNLRNMVVSPKIEQLKNIYKDKTALIICAGPSLEENIGEIAKNQNNCVTFALSPALKLLNKNSITPDFIVSIDVINNIKHFDEVDTLKSYYITDAYTNYITSNIKTKNHFFYISKNNFFNNWARKILNIENNLESLGTSSYTAFQSAILMGFKKIIFIGQDLAFKDGKCYAKNSQYDCLKCIFNSERNEYEIVVSDFESFKKAFQNAYHAESYVNEGAKLMLENLNKNIRTVKDINGNLIPTKADYYTFVKIFEKAAKSIKNIELINASGGANIEGFKNLTLKEALNGLNPIEKLDLSSYKPDYDINKIKSDIDILISNIKNAKEHLEIFKNSADKLLEEIETKQLFKENKNKLIQNYKNTFDELLKCFENEEISALYSCMAYNIYELLKTDYFTDENTLSSALKKIIPVFKNIENEMTISVNCLIESKSLIL